MVINFPNKLKGFSMVEALLAGSLLAMVVFTLASILIFGEESSRIAGDRQRAAALAEEGLEATRNLSEASFSNLTAGSHGLIVSGGKWQFSGVQDNPEIFTRSLIISDVDSNTKAVTSTVSWSASPQKTSSVSLSSLFTNWRRVTSGIGNWASTTVETGYSPSNTSNGIKVRVDGNYAYVGLAGTSANNFLVFDISNPAVPVLKGSTSVAGAITDMEVSGNYVYISSTANAAEMAIVNVTTKTAPVVSDTYDAVGTNNGLSIDVVGTRAYLGRAYSTTKNAAEFYVLNVSDPTNIPAYLGAADLSYSVYDIQVSSDLYAYLATDGNTAELVIIDVWTPSSLSMPSSLDIVGGNTALDAYAIAIFDSGTDGIEDRAIIGRAGEGRIWPINISSAYSPSLLLSSGYTVAGIGTANINHLELFNANKYLAIASSAASAEVVIADITTLASPSVLSTLNIAGTNNFAAMGLAYAAGVDRLLAVGTRIAANSNYILEIIKPN